MVYDYSITSSNRTCHCYSNSDPTCSITFTSVAGWFCAEVTSLDVTGKCVAPSSCPCYYKGSVVPPSQVISKDGAMWWETHTPTCQRIAVRDAYCALGDHHDICLTFQHLQRGKTQLYWRVWPCSMWVLLCWIYSTTTLYGHKTFLHTATLKNNAVWVL